ncbi:MAG TPA: GDP-mannose 4,6-dehydratase [Dongiaceae bacterium]|nr:GDP-mannose 4,6-dehydratase [Dongiaceae bacterium]
MPTALITGINGQDGSYLAEFLLTKGYRVVGTVLNSHSDLRRVHPIREKLEIIWSDLLNQDAIADILIRFRPDEVYNLAARASSRDLWTQPVFTGELNGLTVVRILEGIGKVNPRIRFLQASSSEIFGNAEESPQSETTALHPRNPYGVAKAFAHWNAGVYRAGRKLFACSAILYNHESSRRGIEFVTRKISRAAAAASLGERRKLELGRLEARRDWGFAGDYVRAMWLMLQHSEPDDFVIATGQTHSVRDFCELAFGHVGLDYRDFVQGVAADGRAAEPVELVGNPAKAHRVLGWRSRVSFEDLVRMMVNADRKALDEQRKGSPPSHRARPHEKLETQANLT